MYLLDKCASRSAKNPVTFLVISALVKVFIISNSAAKTESAITVLSRESLLNIGKLKMKISDEGTGTKVMILNPKEVTTAIRSKPIKSKNEIKN
jgi:hypothetical protein